MIGGASQENTSERELTLHHAGDDGVTGRYLAADEADINAAVQSACSAIEGGWSRSEPAKRRGILLRLAELIEANADTLALCDCLDVAKPVSAALGEPYAAAGFVRYYAEAIDKSYGAIAPGGPNAMELQLQKFCATWACFAVRIAYSSL